MDYPVAAIIAASAATYVGATLLGDRIAARGFSLPKEGTRIGCVDGLRGYLALSVLIGHGIIWLQLTALGGTWNPPTVNIFNEFGRGSVALFFMATGLVFYPRVQSGFIRTSWRQLVINRFFRIVPLQFVSVLLVTAIIATRARPSFDAGYLVASAEWMTGRYEPPLFGYAESAQVNAHVLWSLWYEWLFYLLVMPACAFAVDLLRPRLPAIAVALGLLVLGCMAMTFDWRPRLLTLLPLFAIGMLAFECQSSERVRTALCSPRATVGALASLFVAINIAPSPFSFTALPLLGFFFVCVACGNSLGGLLSRSGARVLGEISFGTYLLHGMVLYCLFAFAGPLLSGLSPGAEFALIVPLAAVLVVCIASTAHILLERPAIRLGGSLVKAWSARSVLHQARFAA